MGERELRQRKAANRSQLRTLSEAAKCGLAHYTRGLTIRMIAEEFTPENLQHTSHNSNPLRC